MEFSSDHVRFTVPDRPTVKQQLQYFSEIAVAEGRVMLERYWAGAVPLIEEWECDALNDYKISLDDIDNPSETEVIIWAGMRVMEHMNGLKDIPKN